MALFRNQQDAGQRLAHLFAEYACRPDVTVLALPGGGVPIAYEIALALNLPMDVFVVRKLGIPGHGQLAMGAIAPGGVRIMNEEVTAVFTLPGELIDAVARREQAELERRIRAYRHNRPWPDLKGKTIILVDDGLATGASMRAAVRALHTYDPAHIIVAVPTTAPETCEAFVDKVDEIVCLEMPRPSWSVGLWYETFPQASDEEVRTLLQQAANRQLT